MWPQAEHRRLNGPGSRWDKIHPGGIENSSGITHTQPFTLAEYSPGPEDKYTVTFSASENGSLSASVDGSSIDSGALVKAGKNIVFTAVPDPGYRVAAWIVNGETVSGATGLTYTHENLREDIEVIVTFAEPETPQVWSSGWMRPIMTRPPGNGLTERVLTAYHRKRKQTVPQK